MERWQRRDIKLEKRKNRIKQHGRNIGEIYKNTTLKRRDNGRNQYSRTRET